MQADSPAARTPPVDALARALLDPAATLQHTAPQWNALLLSLRRNALLASFAERLCRAGALKDAPPKAQVQLTYARIAAESARTAVRFEVNRMLRALRDYTGPLVLLKGAAYEFAMLPPAAGRMTGDLDVMVPRSRLDEVERRLVEHGWQSTAQDAYDERYYREWGHEVPSLLHPHRETPIDLHHTIAPLTSRAHPDATALLERAAATSTARLQVLGPVDMVLHSTLHLFNDEVGRPLRDLFDIHLLLTEFGGTDTFWAELLARAELHGVGRPLHYMLRAVRHAFATDIPDGTVRMAASFAPNRPLDACMQRLFRARFAAGFVGSRRLEDRIVSGSHYVRAHWLRMPPLLLGAHLTRKALRRARQRVGGRAPDAATG